MNFLKNYKKILVAIMIVTFVGVTPAAAQYGGDISNAGYTYEDLYGGDVSNSGYTYENLYGGDVSNSGYTYENLYGGDVSNSGYTWDDLYGGDINTQPYTQPTFAQSAQPTNFGGFGGGAFVPVAHEQPCFDCFDQGFGGGFIDQGFGIGGGGGFIGGGFGGGFIQPSIQQPCLDCGGPIFNPPVIINPPVVVNPPIVIQQPPRINNPVNAVCVVSKSSARVGEQVSFVARATGGDGQLRYTWSGAFSGNTQTETVIFNRPGTYNLTLSVRDADGDLGTGNCSVVVQQTQVSVPPVVTPGTPTTFALSATSSIDPGLENPPTGQQAAIVSSVLLSQVPYTGPADALPYILWSIVAILGGIAVARKYSATTYRKTVANRVEAFKEANRQALK